MSVAEQTREQVWQQGHDAGFSDAEQLCRGLTGNPYLADTGAFFSAQENKCSRDGNPATPTCGCDEAKAWKERALKAEARAAKAERRIGLVRVRLGSLLGDVDATIGLIDASEPGDVG